MGRVSRDQADRHRQQIVEAASHVFRERGAASVSIGDVMREVGLTNGGFYRHFPSKDALVAEATANAYEQMNTGLAGLEEKSVDHSAALAELVRGYLSEHNRDDWAGGCVTTGFGSDVARSDDRAVRTAFAQGVRDFAAWLSDEGDAVTPASLVRMSTMVGALFLARATSTTDFSTDVLGAARSHLLRELGEAGPEGAGPGGTGLEGAGSPAA